MTTAPASTLDLDHLGTYLGDHLGGSATGVALANRLAEDNEGTELGAALRRIATEVEEDQETLKQLAERLGVSESPIKRAGGWLAEKAHRLKPNDAPGDYGTLDRLIDLETLTLGVSGKLALWRSLEEVRTSDTRVANLDLRGLADRAARQRDELDCYRLQAAREALAR